MVHWFSGPGGRTDGFVAHADRLGCLTEGRGIMIATEKHNLAGDLVYQKLLDDTSAALAKGPKFLADAKSEFEQNTADPKGQQKVCQDATEKHAP